MLWRAIDDVKNHWYWKKPLMVQKTIDGAKNHWSCKAPMNLQKTNKVLKNQWSYKEILMMQKTISSAKNQKNHWWVQFSFISTIHHQSPLILWALYLLLQYEVEKTSARHYFPNRKKRLKIIHFASTSHAWEKFVMRVSLFLLGLFHLWEFNVKWICWLLWKFLWFIAY